MRGCEQHNIFVRRCRLTSMLTSTWCLLGNVNKNAGRTILCKQFSTKISLRTICCEQFSENNLMRTIFSAPFLANNFPCEKFSPHHKLHSNKVLYEFFSISLIIAFKMTCTPPPNGSQGQSIFRVELLFLLEIASSHAYIPHFMLFC